MHFCSFSLKINIDALKKVVASLSQRKPLLPNKPIFAQLWWDCVRYSIGSLSKLHQLNSSWLAFQFPCSNVVHCCRWGISTQMCMSLVRVPNPLPQEMTSSSQTGNLSCVSPVCTSSGSSVLQAPGAHHPKQALEWAGEPASHNSFSDLPLPFELPASSQVHADLHLEVALSLAATKTTSLPRPGHTNHLPICGVLNFF